MQNAPAPKPLSFILICQEKKVRNAVITAIQATNGFVPVGVGDTSAAHRAYYPDDLARVILNVASPDMHAKLGFHCAALAIEVDDPTLAAEVARGILERAGFEAKVVDDAEPELPKGFMAFLSVPALRGVILLFWPKNPDPEAGKAFRASGRFAKWTDAELDNEEEPGLVSAPV